MIYLKHWTKENKLIKMITFQKGDLFKSSAQSYVIPVNMEGVMGAGLALYARKRFPGLFNAYREDCFNGILSVKGFSVFDIEDNKKIILFPTKTTWKKSSDIRLIIKNLELFRATYKKYKIESCAFPLIGCGLGNLNPNDIIPTMIEHLIDLDIDCAVYIPEN